MPSGQNPERFERLSIPRLGVDSELPQGLPEPQEFLDDPEMISASANASAAVESLDIPRLGIRSQRRPLTDTEKSDFLKRSAGAFGFSEHVKFISEN